MLSVAPPQKALNYLPERLISILSALQDIELAAKVLFTPDPGVAELLISNIRAETVHEDP